jgi:hypothetical protein
MAASGRCGAIISSTTTSKRDPTGKRGGASSDRPSGRGGAIGRSQMCEVRSPAVVPDAGGEQGSLHKRDAHELEVVLHSVSGKGGQKGKGKFRSHRCEVRSPAVPGAGGRERDNIGECAPGPQFDEACPHSTERVFRWEGGRFLWCGDRVYGSGRGAGSAHGLAITKQQKEGNDVLPQGPSLMSPHSTEMVSDVRGEGRGSMWVPG